MNDQQQHAFIFEQPVAWGDMDAFGHINNVWFYRYVESARIAYLTHIDAFKDGQICVIASSNCTYLKPVHYPDTLNIGVNVADMRTSGFLMQYHLYSKKSGDLVAVSESVIVMMHGASFTKSAITPAMRASILALENNIKLKK